MNYLIIIAVWITLLAHVRSQDTCSRNYIIIVDESGSVSRTNFETSYDFVINDLVDPASGDPAIGPTSNIGAFSFSSVNDHVYDIGSVQNDNRAALLAELYSERADYDSGITQTRDALQYAIDMFNANGITNDKKIILITDGIPCCNDESNPCTAPKLTGLDDIDITLVLIDDFNFNELSCLFEPGQTNVISVPNTFDFTGVAAHIRDQETCDAGREGVICESDAHCPCCMQCCPERKVCEYPPAAHESLLHSINEMNQETNQKPTPIYQQAIYGYILVIGIILFVLINNMFIGWWCVCKKSSNQDVQYEKCDVVTINDE
eukprot:428030_1